MIPASKRRCSDQPPPSSKSTIDNLPDPVLVEILCRLPHNKVAFQCKLVSKRWRTLLSDPYFAKRFLRIHHDQQRPLLNQYVMFPLLSQNHKTLVLTVSSELPPLPLEASTPRIYSFSPCFGSPEVSVGGTYNDLVLCSQAKSQRDYFICNFYTKEWIRLPPTPRRHSDVLKPTGFICEPYYNIKEEGTSGNSSITKLDAEYRFKVVRLLTTQVSKAKGTTSFSVEIFSSETGQWREYSISNIVYQQQGFHNFSLRKRGIACNGKLYWLTQEDCIFELDPFNMCSTSDDADDGVIDKCRFIDKPTTDGHNSRWHMGVCRGRLQMCPFLFYGPDRDPMVIWELKEKGNDKPEWCLLHRISSLSEMVHKQPLRISSFCMLDFHPIHKDIVYIRHTDVYSHPGLEIVLMCNVRERTLEIDAIIPFETTFCGPSWVSGEIFPYEIPWWPTPVPARLNYREE